jgi:sugar phosphate isomerase/epimerase
MKIGIFSKIYQDDPVEIALDKIKALGATAVEIGTGGYPRSHHCPLDTLLASEDERKRYLDLFTSRELIISAFSCHYEPLSPDKELAEISDATFRKSVDLAQLMNVPVVNVLSGLPAGSPEDTTPNWAICAWPRHFRKILQYQWDEVGIPYWKNAEQYARDRGVTIGMEMHPGMLVYNVETMLRMRAETGPNIGNNFDPSHLFWSGVDPVSAIRKLGSAIVHMHGKDTYIDPLNTAINGCLDYKPYGQITDRSWTLRTIGYGHDLLVWKNMVTALRTAGYDYVISVEHEDALMSIDEGVSKGMAVLKEAVTLGEPEWKWT